MEILAQRATKVVFREGNYAIKEFNENYSKADVLNEALNQARVEETGLPIPKLIEVKKIDNKWAIIMEYVEGKTIAQLIEEHPEKEDEYLEKFVDVQLSIHQQRAPLLNKLKDKMNRKISETELDATTRYDLHTRLEGMPKHNKVCHGDLGLSDVIITEKGEAFIIDWAHATQGNAAADAARSYLKLCLEGKGEMASKYLKLFCKKSDTAKQYVQKWMPIVAASQTVKGKAEERELLLSWVSVVDYE
ncbi:MAG: phosphotransferase [Oscillospiraceae bacterium]|nr:phosphotransferase [Oscillospiraceae bacterium]MBR4101302.1 phosphotransferase [Oscillospiraceae bacterium]MBR6618132.1 phosphotransferase [Oscillospiraceae bacterium]